MTFHRGMAHPIRNSIVVIALCLIAPAAAYGLTTYTSVGHQFATVHDIALMPGAYDTSMSVSGYFTTADRLLPTSGLVDIRPVSTSFSFFDGRGTIDDTIPAYSQLHAAIETSGMPVGWSILVTSDSSPAATFQHNK